MNIIETRAVLRNPCFVKLFHPSEFERVTAFPPIFVKALEYKYSESGDERLGNWEKKYSAFGRTKVRRKSPAAYQEAQIKSID